jgi:raffinose synthase
LLLLLDFSHAAPPMQNLYRMRATNLARVSDDFYPRLPASHTPHVAVCAFNSLFMGVIVTPDWDMFHSLHPR